MERDQLLACLILYRRLKKIRRKRIHWVHPIVVQRDEFVAFTVLFENLRKYEEKFFNYFRMSVISFDDLFAQIEKSIQRRNTTFREFIPPIQMLAVTIRYLASGCTFTDLHYSYRLGISTISKIVRDVCQAIWILHEEFIPVPTKESFNKIADKFEQTANFPHCIGAVDGKHIRIVYPCNSMYYNYKGFSSIVLMAVADSKYRFIYVSIGSYGKDGDSTIFKECSLWKSILERELEIPNEKCLPGTEGPEVPFFFIGDEAFTLHKHFLRPFSGHSLSILKRVFNYRLSRARRFVECEFGILSNKWRIFHRAINLEPEFANDIVKACVVLHNFVLEKEGYNWYDTLSITGLENIRPSECVRGGISANNVRKIMADYFLTPTASVEWQMSKI